MALMSCPGNTRWAGRIASGSKGIAGSHVKHSVNSVPHAAARSWEPRNTTQRWHLRLHRMYNLVGEMDEPPTVPNSQLTEQTQMKETRCRVGRRDDPRRERKKGTE